jgi:LCP family protein required for cell wall assembly
MAEQPPRNGGDAAGNGDSEEPRDDTQEFALPDDTGEEELPPEPVAEHDDIDDVDDDEDIDDGEDIEDVYESPGPETELEEIINAETQEWDGIDPDDDASDAEDFEDEPAHDDAEKTLVQSARSTITSGFEAVGGGVTGGFKAVKKRARFPLWARFMTASLLIVASVAAATSASLLLYLSDIADALDPDEEFAGITDRLQGVEGGEPQTIMILGSDKRPELKGDGFRGLSDTTMLLRVDPDENALALFSLPRDLRVDIPGYGSDKLNAAYAYGGPELTLRTVQQLTETPDTPNGLQINHVVNIDFEGFARAVNEIDCVYVDVDRRYFHSNDSTSAAGDYEEIDLQPGYQALCGFDALDYARYRHTDNDVVRAARQQDFLREARQKVPPEVLFAERKDLIDVFTKHTTSDIDSVDDMLEVLKLFIEARDAPLKQVKFEGTLGPSFVETTPEEINRAVQQFLGLEDSPGARASSSTPEDPSRVGDTDVAPDQAPVKQPEEKKDNGDGGGVAEDSNIVATTFGKELAKGLRARKTKLPIYYPTKLESGSDYAQKPRLYKINGTGEGSPPNAERAAYKWVFSRPTLGEYYGFMATRWKEPPILKNPSDEREIGDRTYKLYYDGDRLRMIAWQTDDGSFWVSNTLAQSLSDREMLEIAKGMTELPMRGQG